MNTTAASQFRGCSCLTLSAKVVSLMDPNAIKRDGLASGRCPVVLSTGLQCILEYVGARSIHLHLQDSNSGNEDSISSATFNRWHSFVVPSVTKSARKIAALEERSP